MFLMHHFYRIYNSKFILTILFRKILFCTLLFFNGEKITQFKKYFISNFYLSHLRLYFTILKVKGPINLYFKIVFVTKTLTQSNGYKLVLSVTGIQASQWAPGTRGAATSVYRHDFSFLWALDSRAHNVKRRKKCKQIIFWLYIHYIVSDYVHTFYIYKCLYWQAIIKSFISETNQVLWDCSERRCRWGGKAVTAVGRLWGLSCFWPFIISYHFWTSAFLFVIIINFITLQGSLN